MYIYILVIHTQVWGCLYVSHTDTEFSVCDTYRHIYIYIYIHIYYIGYMYIYIYTYDTHTHVYL
jgi:hypothetical protein